jgi:arylsulfatase A-like enzyme
MIMTGPDIPKGHRCDEMVYQHDLFPTLLEAAGAEIPDGTYYQSLWPMLSSNPPAGRDLLCSSYIESQRMVRDRRYKLLEYNVRGQRRTQLFDIQQDPHELHDLSTSPDRADDVARLRKELRAWQQRVGDPCDVLAGD